MSAETATFRFTINAWQHLYSLHQAIRHAENMAANRLIIEGTIRNDAHFNRHDIPIRLVFSQNTTPQYKKTDTDQVILGQLLREKALSADIPVDAQVFSELKKNLAEYIGIDGIHIVVTIGLLIPDNDWPDNTAAAIVTLDYAMKGNGG